MIKCGHCNDEHGTVGETRECSRREVLIALMASKLNVQTTMLELSAMTPDEVERGIAVLSEMTAKRAVVAPVEVPAAPTARPASTSITVTEGMYNLDGKIFRVQRSKDSDRLYAKQFNEETRKFGYSSGMIYQLEPAHRMTVDEAAEVGRRTGTCCVCARELTNAKSINLGIGPICLEKV